MKRLDGMPEGFTPESDFGKRFPGSFAGKSLESAQRLDGNLDGCCVCVDEVLDGKFTAFEKKLTERNEGLHVALNRIIGSGAYAYVMGGKVNGRDTGESMVVRVESSNETTDSQTLQHPIVLDALYAKQFEVGGLRLSLVAFSPELPKQGDHLTEESVKAVTTALRIIEASGKKTHFCDPDPSQFGLLINPETHKPYRYKDGTLMAVVRDRNSAFEHPERVPQMEGLGGCIMKMLDVLERDCDKNAITPKLSADNAQEKLKELQKAKDEVQAHVAREFHLERVPTLQRVHHVVPAHPPMQLGQEI